MRRNAGQPWIGEFSHRSHKCLEEGKGNGRSKVDAICVTRLTARPVISRAYNLDLATGSSFLLLG